MHDRYHHIALSDELDRWSVAGRTARMWWRDDDACRPSAGLEALLERLRRHKAPCLVAVIPMKAEPALAGRLAGEAMIRVAVHGAWHANHAAPGRKTEETPIERGMAAILDELGAARERLVGLFGAEAGRWYVPPWNRIGVDVAARLPELGFRVLSTFARGLPGLQAPPAQVDTHVDLMDWKGGRVGRPAAAVAQDLAAQLALARLDGWRHVGLLTHHLVHDAEAWATMDFLLGLVAAHPAARWCDPADLADEAEAGGSAAPRSGS